MRQVFYTIIIALIFFSCTKNEPYFIIENKTDKVIRIELICDTIDLIGNYFESKKSKLTDSSVLNWNKNSILNYFCNKVSLSQFAIGEIANLNQIKVDETDTSKSKEFVVNQFQKLIKYYNNDTTLIKKILDKKTFTIFLPPNFTFYNQCSGHNQYSCTSTDAFPSNNPYFSTKELRVVLGNNDNDFISMTESSFKRIMNKTKFNSQSDSYILTIKE